MDRRLVITTSFLILMLAALTMAGVFSPAVAPAADTAARIPDPAACTLSAPPVAAAAADAATVASRHLAPAGMSGEFAKRRLA